MHHRYGRIAAVLAFAGFALVSVPARAHADGLIIPFVGYDFGGDAGNCAQLVPCEPKQLTWGVAAAFMAGGAFGIEADFAHAPSFFGNSNDRGDNYLFTTTLNVLVGIPIKAVRPYAVGGLGLIHTNAGDTGTGIVDTISENNFAFDAGGGLMVIFSRHVGLRGDLRYLRTFDTVDLPVQVDKRHLEFWRGTGGVVFRF